ncbi:MAG: SMP-30/gluconolactonase/LRE family protein [Chloroflexi bacterium]|nr:SMP-30/gluconolactonase/LRE family protein [Chloroflexota bacterium]
MLESPQPELVATGFEFTEGPLWHPDGFLYVSDVDARVHYRVDLGSGEKTVIRTDSGGANGATFDADGRVVLCEQDARRVVRLEEDGGLTVVADRYDGKRINRANDVVARRDGTIYFTDPQGLMEESEKELDSSGIFRVDADGSLTLVAGDMNHPNGLAFSPDEDRLYVSNTRPDPHLHVYDVFGGGGDGGLGNSRVLAEMPYVPAGEGEMFRAHSGAMRPAVERGGVPDGLKVDTEGRIFCTGPGGVWVFDSDGSEIGLIELPELPANVAFGDPDLRTLFVTARTSVYRLRVKAPGIPVHGVSSQA